MSEQNVINQVIEVIADVLELDTDEVEVSSSVVSDLGADSLDVVDLSFTLGKQLNIKMPQKSVMMHAESLVEKPSDLVEGDKLTELGAELLQAGPNQYSAEQVAEGTGLGDVFANTTVQHWINLCTAIAESGLTGDELIQQRVEQVLSAQAA